MTAPVRIGFVGAGWWAVANHIPLIAADPRARLAGVCRVGAAELARVRDHFGFPYATEDFARLLDECPMDALVITTPHALHAAQAIAAIERGLHVMVEKPLAVDPAEAWAVVAAAARRGVHALIPYGWNFMPFAAAARDLVAAGRLGAVRHVSGRMASPIGDLMAGGAMPGTEALMFRPDPAMWSDPRTGGYGYGQLIHLLGLLFLIAPELRAATVAAVTGCSERGGDLYDALALRFACGATGALSGAATLPQGAPFELDLDVYGSEGVLSVSVFPARVVLRRQDGTVEALDLDAAAGAYACVAPVRRFVDLVAGEAAVNPAGPEIGAKAVEVVAAMHGAARSGRTVTIGGGDA